MSDVIATEARPPEVATKAPILEVDHLAVTFYTPRGTVRAVRDASLEIHRGEVLGLVGESGCGKSTVALAVMGYLPGTARIAGSITFEGRDIAAMSDAELSELRGNRIAMVYQDPATSLNPTMRVGPQVEEVLREHLDMDAQQARERAAELFDNVGLAGPRTIGRRYPHQLSGGMQQRVVIAMALACDPDLLIMDEPTTGLDVTTEATIIDLVVDLKERVDAGILFATHNLGVIARVADRVSVMYAGQDRGAGAGAAAVRPATAPLHGRPAELRAEAAPPRTGRRSGCAASPAPSTPPRSRPPTRASSHRDARSRRAAAARKRRRMLPANGGHEARCFFSEDVRAEIWGASNLRPEHEGEVPAPVLSAKDLRQFYGSGRRKYVLFGPLMEQPVRAVVDIDFEVASGRTLGIVGESGSGKSTTAKSIAGLIARDRGEVELHGDPLPAKVEERTREQRAALRMVFQNPTASLNPKLPIRHAIVRALRKFAGLGRQESRTRAAELLEAVGMDPAYLDRHPGELSGGEQQRVALAGAFAAEPDLIIADEAVSALDVSVQAQVLNLLGQRQREAGTSYIFITHDLGVVRYVSDDILVLYAGHVAESGPAERVLNAPSHPYTEALLSAAPVPDPDATPTRIRLQGAVPTLRRAFPGCFFAGRCPRKVGEICDTTPPPARPGSGPSRHVIHCHIPVDELAHAQRETPASDAPIGRQAGSGRGRQR